MPITEKSTKKTIYQLGDNFGKGSRYHFCIFSKGGFTDGLRELGEKGEVTLLTLDDIYR